MKKNILTISDGNGVDTDFKKWPFYLGLLMSKTANIINRSVIGASNELMFMKLADSVDQEEIDFAIVQWSFPNRLDVVANEFWQAQAKEDSVYHFNFTESAGKEWWVTSASENSYIRDYHEKYINKWQATQRSQTTMLAAAELLKQKGIKFVFSLCYEFNFVSPTKNILETYPWVWHSPNQGLSEFRTQSRFAEFDTGLPRPHTLIQLDWIDKVLRPSCEFIDYNQTTYYNIEQTLLKTCSK